MKKLCFVIAAILCASAIKADLCEDFNSLTSGSWTTETAVELPSGTWMFGGGLQYNKSNNVVSLKFNQTGAYLITPVLDSVTSVEFKHRSGGSKKQIDVAYRIGLGEWVEVNSVSSPSSSTFSSFSCKLGTDSAQSVQVRFSGTNNTYIDDVVLKQYVAGSGEQGTVVPEGNSTAVSAVHEPEVRELKSSFRSAFMALAHKIAAIAKHSFLIFVSFSAQRYEKFLRFARK